MEGSRTGSTTGVDCGFGVLEAKRIDVVGEKTLDCVMGEWYDRGSLEMWFPPQRYTLPGTRGDDIGALDEIEEY